MTATNPTPTRFATLTAPVVDISGDTDFYLPIDTVVVIVSDEGPYSILETTDGQHQFPVYSCHFQEIES